METGLAMDLAFIYLNIKIYYYEWCLSVSYNNILRGKSRVYYPCARGSPPPLPCAPTLWTFITMGLLQSQNQFLDCNTIPMVRVTL